MLNILRKTLICFFSLFLLIVQNAKSEDGFPAYVKDSNSSDEGYIDPVIIKPAKPVEKKPDTKSFRKIYFDEDDKDYANKEQNIEKTQDAKKISEDLNTKKEILQNEKNIDTQNFDNEEENLFKNSKNGNIHEENINVQEKKREIQIKTKQNTVPIPIKSNKNVEKQLETTKVISVKNNQDAESIAITQTANENSNNKSYLSVTQNALSNDTNKIILKYRKNIPLPVKEPKKTDLYYSEYEIEQGDTLEKIGKTFGVNADEMAIVIGVEPKAKLKARSVYKIPVLSYVVQNGDTAKLIAEKHKVSITELKNINSGNLNLITGSTILLPILDKKRIDISSEIDKIKQDIKPNFVWPVNGKVYLSSFRGEGVKNDGILILTKDKENVVAIENGLVSYVGNNIKGYGDMIIIKHDQGYISIYGNTEGVKIKKRDKVVSGQNIATVTKNNLTNSSLLYFSLRKDKKVLDAINYLPKIKDEKK